MTRCDVIGWLAIGWVMGLPWLAVLIVRAWKESIAEERRRCATLACVTVSKTDQALGVHLGMVIGGRDWLNVMEQRGVELDEPTEGGRE